MCLKAWKCHKTAVKLDIISKMSDTNKNYKAWELYFKCFTQHCTCLYINPQPTFGKSRGLQAWHLLLIGTDYRDWSRSPEFSLSSFYVYYQNTNSGLEYQEGLGAIILTIYFSSTACAREIVMSIGKTVLTCSE